MKWPIHDKGELAEPPQIGSVTSLSKSARDMQMENLNPDVAEFVPHVTTNGSSGIIIDSLFYRIILIVCVTRYNTSQQ